MVYPLSSCVITAVEAILVPPINERVRENCMLKIPINRLYRLIVYSPEVKMDFKLVYLVS